MVASNLGKRRDHHLARHVAKMARAQLRSKASRRGWRLESFQHGNMEFSRVPEWELTH